MYHRQLESFVHAHIALICLERVRPLLLSLHTMPQTTCSHNCASQVVICIFVMQFHVASASCSDLAFSHHPMQHTCLGENIKPFRHYSSHWKLLLQLLVVVCMRDLAQLTWLSIASCAMCGGK